MSARSESSIQSVRFQFDRADVNRELDVLEGELLKLFPGQPKRVAAFLEATRPASRRSSRETETETGRSPRANRTRTFEGTTTVTRQPHSNLQVNQNRHAPTALDPSSEPKPSRFELTRTFK